MWLAAEVPMTITSICLPMIFNLGRQIPIKHLSGWTSKLSTLVSSSNNNMNLDEHGMKASGAGKNLEDYHLHVLEQGSTVGFGATSIDSRRRMLDTLT
jgi:hypothetical protein